jgi:hypothetical protein
VSQPLDRACTLPELGAVDRENGEFWAGNAFMIPQMGENLSAYERNCLFLNIDGDKFINASFASAVDIDADSRSVVAADFDRDGATDLLVGSVGGGSLRLFRNRFPTAQRSVQVRLEGVKSNRSAIGARVVAELGVRKIVRDLFPADGFSGQSPAEMTLGLGGAERIDRLTVRWPSGATQVFHGVSGELGVISIREGESTLLAGKTL